MFLQSLVHRTANPMDNDQGLLLGVNLGNNGNFWGHTAALLLNDGQVDGLHYLIRRMVL